MTAQRLILIHRYTFPLTVWRVACQRYAHSPEEVREAWAESQVRAGRFHGFAVERDHIA